MCIFTVFAPFFKILVTNLGWATMTINLTTNSTQLYYITEESIEGKQVFLEKRQPNFHNYHWLL